MKLSIEQLRSMTQGAVRVFEIDGSACFRRFTEEQEELYRQKDGLHHPGQSA